MNPIEPENYTPLAGFSQRLNEMLEQLGKPLRGRPGDISDLMRDTKYPVSISATTRWLKNDVYPGVDEIYTLVQLLHPSLSHGSITEICKYLTWGGEKINTNAQVMMAVFRSIALHPRSALIRSNQNIDAAANVIAEHMQRNSLDSPDAQTVDLVISLLISLQELP